MSHFSVLVIGDDVEGQLAPYHEFECTGINDEYVEDVDITEELLSKIDQGESLLGALEYYGIEGGQVASEDEVDRNGTHMYGFAVVQDDKLVRAVNRTNPRKKWDWYQIGGRWTGYFKLKQGAHGVVGEPGLMTSPANPGYADQAQKCDIDFEAMREEYVAKRLEEYRKFHDVVAGRPAPIWDEVRERHGAENLNAARAEYNNHPVMKDLRQADFWFADGIEPYLVSEDEHLRKARARAISTFAVVKDGHWYQKGKMGWWGMVSNEKDQDAWNEEFNRLLDDLPDNTLLTVVDCHI
jgi:hypothetical protein